MNKHYRIYLLIIGLFLGAFNAEAYHIIGGEVSYKCLGNDMYLITITMYRDCSTMLGADFDSNPGSPPATVTVWRDDLDKPYYRTIILDRPVVTKLDPNKNNPCMTVPPNVCVEKGVYKFKLKLLQSRSSYHIVYQRCCRNTTIVNIVDPGSVGTTYHIELTPEAQRQCTDSPVFNNFPPIAICAGYPLVVDQSVSDNDPGTTFRYSFCAPFVGGGKMGTNPGENSELPNGVTPNPDTRPPYNTVTYVSGYSAQNPLKANPKLKIDPQTGIITGTPTAIGQYVVGVCVEQIKNGVVLSKVKRDFQFNVTECIPKVDAAIEAKEVGENRYVILQCGDYTVDFINLSTDENFIQSYEWTVDLHDGSQDVFTDKNISYTFPDTGIYNVRMFLNKGLQSCTDTAFITVEIRDSIQSIFSLQGDSCIASSVHVENNSFSRNGAITSYNWIFEEGNTSSLKEPDPGFTEPGDKHVTLAVEDVYGCVDTSFVDYPFYPKPSVIDISIVQELICTNTAINITNNSHPLDSTYEINWYLSNGDIYHGMAPEFNFEEAGVLDLTLEIISPIGCYKSKEFKDFFEIYRKPDALFTYTPKELSQFNKTVNFTNQSTGANDYLWKFDEDGSSIDINPTFTFPDTGLKEITLYAEAFNGCVDTFKRIIDIIPVATYFLPTAFTPDRDGINDGYRGEGYFPFIENFTMAIYTRWGERVFETDDPLATWNGLYMNTGKRLPQGVYIVRVRFTDPRGNVIKKEGIATLLD